MKVLVVIAAVAAYFAVMVAVVPPLYLESYTSYPAPVHSVTVSDDVISLGESFRLRVDVVNPRLCGFRGDIGRLSRLGGCRCACGSCGV